MRVADGIAKNGPNAAKLAAVELIYTAASNPAIWPDALQAIAQCFDDAGTLLIHVRDDGQFGIIASSALVPMIEDFRRGNYPDIRSIRSRERGYFLTRDVITDRDVVTADEMDTAPLYSDFLSKYGLRYFAAAALSPKFGLEASIAVQRESSKPEYSVEELQTLVWLGSHVEKALRLSMRLIEAEVSSVGLQEALAQLSVGVVALDTLGRVLFANRAAENMLGNGVLVVNNRFTGCTATDWVRLDALVEQALNNEEEMPKPIVVNAKGTTRPLAVHALPVGKTTDHTARLFSRARILLLLTDLNADAPADPSVIRDILGVTLGEAKVASLVGAGLSPKEVAATLGITEETTRTVLKRVFSKVGVSRQSELAVLLGKFAFR